MKALFPVTLIVTHGKPYFDEWVAIKLLRAFGEEIFPGVGKAQVIYRDAASSPDDGMTAEQVEASGILAVGIWGGRFDEHATETHGRRRDDCAATLVAKALGVADDPGIKPILDYILVRDTGKMAKGSGESAGDLYRLVDVIYEYNTSRDGTCDPLPALEFMNIAFDAMLGAAIRWNTVTGAEYAEKAKQYEFAGPGGKTFKVVAVTTDNDQINRYARSKAGGQAAIVIQRNTRGNTQVFFNLWNVSRDPGFQSAMLAIRRAVRSEEARAIGMPAPPEDELSREGFVLGWYGEKDGLLLNGSKKAPHVPPTELPLDQIVEIVQVCLDPNRWAKAYAAECRTGVCAHSAERQCPLYAWGLARCKKNRVSQATDDRRAAEQAKNIAALGRR